MANRYWVGGTGTWDTTSTTNWSATSGGASGAPVPTSSDSIFFDQAGIYNVTLTGGLNCLDWTVSAGAVTYVTGTTPSMTVNGNVTWGAGNVVAFSGATFSWTFQGLGGTRTISTNGVAIPGNATTFNNGTFNLGSAFFATNNITHLSNPTINTNGYAFVFQALFGIAGHNWGSSTVTSTSSPIFAASSNITLNAGTSNLICTGPSGVSLNAAGTPAQTFYNVAFTNNGGFTASISNVNTFNNLSFTAGASAFSYPVTFSANQTINGSLSTVNTAGNSRIFFASATYGLAYTLTINGTPNLIDADFRDLYIKGGAAPLNGIRIGNRGNCAGINFSIPKTVYWNLAGVQNWSANGWATTPTGTPSTDNFPLPQDTATFTDAGSVTSTITLDNGIGYVPTVDMSARTTAMTLAFNNATTCYGNWTNGSGTSFSGTLALTFSGGRTQTITSAGKTFTCPITIDTYGGTVQLADSLNLTTGNLVVTNGTFNTLGYAVTAGALSSTNSNVRTINLGASTVTLNGVVNKFTCSTTTNLTFNAGTSNIIFPSDSGGNWATVDAGTGLVFYDVSITGSNAGATDSTLLGACTFRNLTFVRAAFDGISRHSFNADIIVTGTLTISTTSATRRIGLKSSTPGTPRTITAGAFSGSDCDFQDIILAGAAAGASPTRAGNCGGNSGITFPSVKTVYWNLAGTQNWSATAWCTSADGGTTLSAPDVNNFPLPQDTAVLNNTGSAGTITIQTYNLGTFDASLRTTAATITSGVNVTVFGDWKFGTGITSTVNTSTLTFSKNGTQTFTSNGIQFGCNITVNHPLGVVQLADALSLNSAKTLSLILGTFDAVSYNVTTGLFQLLNSNTVLKMGSGTWTISGTGTCWSIGNTLATINIGTSTIVLSDTSTTARTFQSGGFYCNKLTIGGSTGTSTLTISSGLFVGELASTKTVAHTILFSSSYSYIIGKWSVTGTVGNVVTVGPTTSATTYALAIAGPANPGIDYLSISYCALSTTSPGEFYVGANSTNTAGNTGAIVFTATPSPRTLYWVGGTGNWSATTSWSTSSGGSSGAAIPTSLDSVNFNSSSNATAYTATIDAGVTIARCAAFNMAGPASGNITWAGTVTIAFHGNVTFAASGITRSYSGSMYWVGNSSYTFTTNGLSLGSDVTVYGVGATWTLGSALTITNTFNVFFGNFNTSASNYNITASTLWSNYNNVRGISLNGSTFTSTGSGGIIDFGTITNLTFNAGTSSLNIAGNSLTFNGGGLTFYNVIITAAAAAGTIKGANIFNNLTISTQTNLGAWQLTFNANQTINGTFTLGAGTAAAYRTFLSSDTIGTQRTLTCAAISSLTDIDFRDINFAGAITLPVTGTRLGDGKGNSNITFGAGKTVYYSQTGTSNWGTTGTGSWSLTSGGAFDATAFPLAQDTAVFPAATYPASGSSVTINSTYNIGTIDMSLRTANTMTLTLSSGPTVYGNWITGTGITFTGNPILTFAGRTSQSVTNAGKIWPMNTIINSPGGSVTLQDNWETSNITSTPPMSLIAGTFDANGYNVTFASTSNVNAGFSTSGALAKTLAMGSGTWTFGCAGITWQNTATNLTITGTGTISLTNSAAKSFSGYGYYAGITLNQGGAGTLTISGSNTFKNITNSYNTTGATTILISLGMIQTLSQFTATGTAGNLLTITGTSASSPATLIYTGSGSIPTIDYVVPTYVKAYPTTSTWFVGSSSTNAGSLGFIFPNIQPLGSFMTFF
jgi:hypothetical protein